MGIDATALPRAGHRPVSKSNKPETRKAPTAVENGNPIAPDEISKAAPGVLQTTLIGILYRWLSRIESRPNKTVLATTADVV